MKNLIITLMTLWGIQSHAALVGPLASGTESITSAQYITLLNLLQKDNIKKCMDDLMAIPTIIENITLTQTSDSTKYTLSAKSVEKGVFGEYQPRVMEVETGWGYDGKKMTVVTNCNVYYGQ